MGSKFWMPTGCQRCVKPAHVFDTSICNTSYKTKAYRLNDLPQAQTGVGAGAWAWLRHPSSACPTLLWYGRTWHLLVLIAVTKYLKWGNSGKEELLGFSVLRSMVHSLAAKGPRPQQVRETREEVWMRRATAIDTQIHAEALSEGQRLVLHFIFLPWLFFLLGSFSALLLPSCFPFSSYPHLFPYFFLMVCFLSTASLMFFFLYFSSLFFLYPSLIFLLSF